MARTRAASAPLRFSSDSAIGVSRRLGSCRLRLIIVGDASMAPYELFSRNGSIYYNTRSDPSIKKLEFLAKSFKHSVWLNPKYEYTWSHTQTIEAVQEVFPMFEITLHGLEKAVEHLMKKN